VGTTLALLMVLLEIMVLMAFLISVVVPVVAALPGVVMA
jgi:hypothetical protein